MSQNESYRDQVEAFIIRLAKASKMMAIYEKDHRLAHEVVNQVFDLLQLLFEKHEEFTIGIIADEIAFDKKPYIHLSGRLTEFIARLKEKGLKKVTFFHQLTKDELLHFINTISVISKNNQSIEETRTQFDAHGIKHILVGQISIEEEDLLLYGDTDIDKIINKSFNKGVDVLKEQTGNISKRKPLDIESLRLIAAALVNCLVINKSMIMMLSSIKMQDQQKYIHNLIVCVFTLLQAEMLGLDKKYFVDIASAALLHNIGTLAEEEDATNRTLEERIDQALGGVKIILNTQEHHPLPIVTTFECVIPYSQSKYYTMMHGKGLNLISMLIAISKVYDKLRRSDAYNRDGGVEKVYEKMIEMSGKILHPDLVHNFFNIIGVFPPGTLVQLESGVVGIVVRPSILDMRRPKVEVLYNKDGSSLQPTLTIDLLEKDIHGRYKQNIHQSVVPSNSIAIPNQYLS